MYWLITRICEDPWDEGKNRTSEGKLKIGSNKGEICPLSDANRNFNAGTSHHDNLAAPRL
jgi:hypothetical protein